jgi:hypothetical protein
MVMNHSITNVYIFLDTRNRFELIQCIVDTIPFMDGWSLDNNIKMNMLNYEKHPDNFVGAGFGFQLEDKRFYWRSNTNSPWGDERIITNMAELSELLDWLNENEYSPVENANKNNDCWYAPAGSYNDKQDAITLASYANSAYNANKSDIVLGLQKQLTESMGIPKEKLVQDINSNWVSDWKSQYGFATLEKMKQKMLEKMEENIKSIYFKNQTY